MRDQKHPEAAIASFREALQLRPDFADPYSNLAAVLRAEERPQEAIGPSRTLLTLRPDDAAAHLSLAAALSGITGWDAALSHYQAALRIDPQSHSARHGVAEALRQLGHLEAAEQLFRTMLTECPDQAERHNDLANVLHQRGRHADAIALCRRALALQPDLTAAHVNLGNVLKATRDVAAEASYRAAIALEPDNADAHLALGALLLRGGLLREGWPELEWRFRCSWRFLSFPPRTLPQPHWKGEELAGRTLLLHAEQGFGDSLHFCRYVSAIAQRGRVVLELPKALVRLAASLDGMATVVPYGQKLPPFDMHCPLLSLPLVVGTTLQTIPATVPYLRAAPEAVAAWQRRLQPLAGLRVGLAWAGNPHYPNDRWRSATLQQLAPLAAVPGVTFVSLQKGAPAAQAATPPAGMVLHDWTAELQDFADTAALVEALDLVISTDTSVPHLAGALGKPVWLLNSYDACWRWLLDRDDSPWYPTLRQFRQPRIGDWETPVEAIRTALQAYVGNSGG